MQFVTQAQDMLKRKDDELAKKQNKYLELAFEKTQGKVPRVSHLPFFPHSNVADASRNEGGEGR
jgi:hypothetical protein